MAITITSVTRIGANWRYNGLQSPAAQPAIFKPWEIVMDPNETEIDLCPERAEGRCSHRDRARMHGAETAQQRAATDPGAEDRDCDRVKGRRCRARPGLSLGNPRDLVRRRVRPPLFNAGQNQHCVLAAFEREGCPRQIDDPLPAAGARPKLRPCRTALGNLAKQATASSAGAPSGFRTPPWR